MSNETELLTLRDRAHAFDVENETAALETTAEMKTKTSVETSVVSRDFVRLELGSVRGYSYNNLELGSLSRPCSLLLRSVMVSESSKSRT